MAIVHAGKIMPLFKIDERLREICRRLIFDEREFEGEGDNRSSVSDPLSDLLALSSTGKAERVPAAVQGGTVEERLKNRIIDGNRVGLQADLEEARKKLPPLEIINGVLLEGMKVVGELFGSGQMQLPFVLQSAEVMKAAVSFLEPFMEKKEGDRKGTMVIATVKGDVHDIGKNLVDIILTNNGYRVVNLGIKCPVETMLQAAEEHHADAIGMSGLLVKSTLVMKENLAVMKEQNLEIPVVLGGAALTRRYVEQDLRSVYQGPVLYANDAFDGLRFMEKIVNRTLDRISSVSEAQAPGDNGDRLTGLEAKIALTESEGETGLPDGGVAAPALVRRSAVRTDVPVPTPPFWGSRVVTEIPLDDVYRYINEVALIRGQWRVVRGSMEQSQYDEILKKQIYPDFGRLKEQARAEKLLEPRVVYGYFPCHSEGEDLIVYHPSGENPTSGSGNLKEWVRFTFPRQPQSPSLCIADFFAPVESGRVDVVAFHLVTMGKRASEYSRRLFERNDYKEYLYFHRLSVESAEALAELWHKRIREELGIAGSDHAEIRKLFSQHYQGSRYSFGYPACPNLEDQAKLFELIQPERIGVTLTEEFQLDPEQSTSAIIVHHPQARYFNVNQR
ncbi:MAG: vitamin B12 dependent-methionine synthase activation domain-containing protein, partial [Bacteroidota bacterium]